MGLAGLAVVLWGGALPDAQATPAASQRAPAEGASAAHAAERAATLSFGAASPVALDPGMATGVRVGFVGGRWRGALPLRPTLSLGWLQAGGDTANWRVDHHELRLLAGVETAWQRGRGAWTARLQAGAAGVYETRLRHQSKRLTAGGVSTTAAALAPLVALQVGGLVRLVGPASAVVTAGPTWTWRRGASAFGWVGGVALRWRL